MKKIILLIALLTFASFSGCGYKEGVSTAAAKSYLYFTGHTDDALVSIDKGTRFSVDNGKNNQYAINPGKHIIEIYKNDSLVIKREIFVSDGISKEIEIQ